MSTNEPLGSLLAWKGWWTTDTLPCKAVSQPARPPSFVLFGHLLQIRKNPCYSCHFEYLTEGSRTQHCQRYAVQEIIQNKQPGNVWVNSQRLREGVRNKELLLRGSESLSRRRCCSRIAPQEGTAGCAETAGGTWAKGNKMIGIGVSKVLWLQSVLEATFSQPLSASYFLLTIRGV